MCEVKHFYLRHDGHDWEWFLWDLGWFVSDKISEYLKTHIRKTCLRRSILVDIKFFFEKIGKIGE